MFSVPLQKDIGGGKPELFMGSNLEIRITNLFKEPFLIVREDVAGWFYPPEHVNLDEQPVWKRLPEIQPLSSNEFRSKHNLTLLFRRPLRLPPLKLGGSKALGVSPRDARRGIYVDGVALQARDPSEAGMRLRSWGATQFNDLTDAFEMVVGIEEDPIAAERLLAKRLEAERKRFRQIRGLAAMIIVPPAGRLIERQTVVEVVGVGVMVAMSAIFAALFAFTYRMLRFRDRPYPGRSHGEVMVRMAPIFLAGLVGLTALHRGCYCDDLPLVVHAAAFWAPFAWINGAMAAGLGFLGIKPRSTFRFRAVFSPDRSETIQS